MSTTPATPSGPSHPPTAESQSAQPDTAPPASAPEPAASAAPKDADSGDAADRDFSEADLHNAIDAEFQPAGAEPGETAEASETSGRSGLLSQNVTLAGAASMAVAAALAGGFMGVVFDPDPAPSGALSGPDRAAAVAVERRLAALEAGLSQTETRVAAAEAQLASPAAPNAGTAAPSDAAQAPAAIDLTPRVAALETADVTQQSLFQETQTRLSGLDAQLSGLTDRVGSLESAATQLATRATGAASAPAALANAPRSAEGVLALAALQEAAANESPFADELAAAREVLPSLFNAPPLEGLSRHAETGAPDLDSLRGRFRAMAQQAVAAEGDGGGLLQRLGRAITNSVTLRRSDAPEASQAASDVIARARRLLNQDPPDLTAVLAELERLRAPALAAAAPWMADARARAAIDAGLEALQTSEAD